jgi:hypothetical protein
MASVLIILLLVLVLGPVARAYAQRLSRGDHTSIGPADGDVARLREEVDRLSADVARLQEEQSFMMKLLSGGEQKRIDEGRHTTE